jgi:tetratricopeptide (TPR) repeat protein
MLSNGRGTGFPVGDGSWIVTCYHVVHLRLGDEKDLPVDQALVLSPWTGEPLKARVVATDEKADLALLKLERGRLPALPIASAASFEPAIQNPKSKIQDSEERFTIVGFGQTAAQIEKDPEIGLNHTPAELLAAAQKAERQVLLFAPTAGAGPGWSGGPVVNMQGEVVGVFRALVAQPQMKDTWYPLATGVEPLRALLKAHGVAPTPSGATLPEPDPEAGSLFQREFRALVWGLARRWDRVETERRALVSRRASDPVARLGLSLALLWQGKLPEALQEAETAVSLDPKRAGALYQQGLVLQKLGRLEDAEERMRGAIELEPQAAERRITLGVMLAAQGKTAEANALLRSAAESSPHHPLAHWRLGLGLQAEGKTEEAVAALRRAARLAEPLPPLRVIRVDLAELLRSAGKLDEAEQEFRELARAEDDPAMQFHLAAFLASRQKSPEALQVVRKCLSLLAQTPNDELLQKATELKTKLESSPG